MHVDLGALVPLPALMAACGIGVGVAVCPTLGLLVTSSGCRTDDEADTLSVFALPDSIAAGTEVRSGLVRVCALGGASTPAPMQFKFGTEGRYSSGWLAFTGPPNSYHLLVTDAGHNAVHVIDVAGRVHVGYVAALPQAP